MVDTPDEPIDDSNNESANKLNENKVTKYSGGRVDSPAPYLPSAEAYIAQASNIDLLIKELKGNLKREFQDELIKIEYTLAKKEQEIALLKLELQRQQNLIEQQREFIKTQNERISKIEGIEPEGKASPYSSEKEQSIESIQRELDEEKEYLSGAREKRDATQFTQKQPAHNPTGRGGLPDREGASGISINQSAYIGDKIKLGKEPQEELTWNPDEGKYNLAVPTDGLQYTFFSAEMAYLNKGYNCQQSQAYSQNIFKKQVWYAQTPKGRYEDGVGPQYKGKVPLQYFLRELSERLNPVQFLPNGGIIENQDFRKAFANWRYKYQVGKFFKTRQGELYSINEIDESRSQGNPPAYRTAGRDNPARNVIAGERVKTSNEERRQWLRNRKL